MLSDLLSKNWHENEANKTTTFVNICLDNICIQILHFIEHSILIQRERESLTEIWEIANVCTNIFVQHKGHNKRFDTTRKNTMLLFYFGRKMTERREKKNSTYRRAMVNIITFSLSITLSLYPLLYVLIRVGLFRLLQQTWWKWNFKQTWFGMLFSHFIWLHAAGNLDSTHTHTHPCIQSCVSKKQSVCVYILFWDRNICATNIICRNLCAWFWWKSLQFIWLTK